MTLRCIPFLRISSLFFLSDQACSEHQGNPSATPTYAARSETGKHSDVVETTPSLRAVFDDCDLALALFGNTVLEKADFRTAYHYALDPEGNRVKGARFSALGLAGLLRKYGLVIEGV